MAATVAMQRKIFVTAQEEVAHGRLLQNKWYPGGQPVAAIENEEEVKFIGQDAYVPRLVAANVPIVKPQEPEKTPIQEEKQCYAEPLQAKRPTFLRGQGGGGIVPSTGGVSLPSGGGAVPLGKGSGKGQQAQPQPQFPFNLISGPGL
ncbi:unnamed protein product [Polarella glacialis]|uniref:Uncharacterized protein n=1 Tax=Polarella glacialis TaxID=89957 RepID=A0A813JNE5_POLGL|nr:unnamed protein product [Polarella glacialis]CAE8680514.1 unnamed protein product [Polarella glacialis]|mmetsp:Transcript_5982/g.9559  ORF Transcript_5982/g.9559 Transcript_5982/m.9559 type:complete len:147 (+) Transcript_5982:91-531(+)|eukprot:CAMPEP_0115103206 /NCGR_PEP_ID=MMETSP0227-20121206/34431_1 /TAXON_ID=89957 /ORGANISM="Polarella glacialis, Strain CCMP 1383" /LENGTH=146 /DNA_ID=CAMNT_0002499587 /DNA_START=87 /DNA_END=527 /DNA_ORIENTATION=-